MRNFLYFLLFVFTAYFSAPISSMLLFLRFLDCDAATWFSDPVKVSVAAPSSLF